MLATISQAFQVCPIFALVCVVCSLLAITVAGSLTWGYFYDLKLAIKQSVYGALEKTNCHNDATVNLRAKD